MIKIRAKSKYFFEGDIIRHLLWGHCEINIEFLNLGQPLIAGIGCHVLLLKLFSVGIWRKLLGLLDADGDGEVTTEELKVLDIDGDGKLSKDELRAAISKVVGLSTIEGQDALLDYVLDAAGDADKDGQLTVDEINRL